MEYLIHGCKGQWLVLLFLIILSARLQNGLQLIQGQDREESSKAKEQREENSQVPMKHPHPHS